MIEGKIAAAESQSAISPSGSSARVAETDEPVK
jgi:hypothetical protein